jgi:hypothetical protein
VKALGTGIRLAANGFSLDCTDYKPLKILAEREGFELKLVVDSIQVIDSMMKHIAATAYNSGTLAQLAQQPVKVRS